MSTITMYNAQGRLTASLTADPPVLEPTKASVDWIEGEWDGDTHYVVDGEPTLRPSNPATLDGMTLRNVPVPATVTINGTKYETDSETVELEFDQPTRYTVVVSAFPYLDKEFTIENQTP